MNKTLLYFTTCYVRELPYASRLFDSLKKHDPNGNFIAVLVDDKSNIPQDFKVEYTILPMSDIDGETLTELSNRYNWNELKNNCKPFIFSNLLKSNKQVIYLDCSTVFHKSNTIFEETLALHNAFVVPQIQSTNQHSKENDALNLGIFHNGCMGFNASETTDKWIEWWKNRTRFKGFYEPCKGMNTDRLCLEFAPVLFENTFVLKNIGVNIGKWTFGKRKKLEKTELITSNYQNLRKSKLLPIPPKYGISVRELSFLEKHIAPILHKINQKIDDFFNRYYVYAQD